MATGLIEVPLAFPYPDTVRSGKSWISICFVHRIVQPVPDGVLAGDSSVHHFIASYQPAVFQICEVVSEMTTDNKTPGQDRTDLLTISRNSGEPQAVVYLRYIQGQKRHIIKKKILDILSVKVNFTCNDLLQDNSFHGRCKLPNPGTPLRIS